MTLSLSRWLSLHYQKKGHKTLINKATHPAHINTNLLQMPQTFKFLLVSGLTFTTAYLEANIKLINVTNNPQTHIWQAQRNLVNSEIKVTIATRRLT
jgi:hypothetical protein